MSSVDSPNTQLKQRIAELRQILEKKKKKLQSSMRVSQEKAELGDPTSGHSEGPKLKKVRFSEPLPLSVDSLCSQPLFDEEEDLEEVKEEEIEREDSRKASSSISVPLQVSRLAFPCERDGLLGCDLLLLPPNAFASALFLDRVELFFGPLLPGKLQPCWSRQAAASSSFLLARLLPSPPGSGSDITLMVGEAKASELHLFCMTFTQASLTSAHPLAVLPRPSAPPDLSCGPDVALLATNEAQHCMALLISSQTGEWREETRCRVDFPLLTSALLTSQRALVLARTADAPRCGLLRLQDGRADFLPSLKEARTLRVLRWEGELCFFAGLEKQGLFLACLSTRTFSVRRLRRISLEAPHFDNLQTAFLTPNVFISLSGGSCEATEIDWVSCTGSKLSCDLPENSKILLCPTSQITVPFLCCFAADVAHLLFWPSL